MYIYTHTHTHTHTHICMYVYMYVCMYVCIGGLDKESPIHVALNCKEEWTLREFYTRECIGTPYENNGVQYVRRSGNGITLEGKVRWRNRMIIASNPSRFVLGTLPFSLKFLTQVTYIPTCLQCLLT
jgi:hypothetical protein